MNRKKLFSYNKYNVNLIILLFLWFGIWMAIGSEPKNITVLFASKLNFATFFDGIRAISPIVISIFCVFLILLNHKKIKINQRPGFIFELYVLYIILQSIGLLFSGTSNPETYQDSITYNSLTSLYWLIALICPLLIFFILKEMNLNNFINLFFFLSIFILLCSFSLYFVKIFASFWHEDSSMYGQFPAGIVIEAISANAPPRSSGIARQGLILYIFFIFSMFYFKNQKNDNFIYLFLFLITLCIATALFLLQSRLIILIFFIINFFIFFFFIKTLFINRLILFLVYLVVPFFFAYLLSDVRPGDKLSTYWRFDRHYEKNKVDFTPYWFYPEKISAYGEDFSIDKNYILLKDNKKNLRVAAFRHSGRIDIWKDLFVAGSKKPLTGWGPQADRFLYAKGFLHHKYVLTLSASNAILYAFLCGGIFAALIFIWMYLYALYSVTIVFATKKRSTKTSKEIMINSSLLITVSILLRSLFESSHSVFGIDYLIFFISILVILNEVNKDKNYKKNYLKNFLFKVRTIKGI